MQHTKPSYIIQFENNTIIDKIKESISAYKLDTKLGTGTYNLPNVSELSNLEVTQDNIPQMNQLCKKLTDIQREFVQGIEYTISNTTTNKTVRDTVVKDKLSKAEPFARALTQFKQKIDAKIAEELKKPISTLQETELRVLREMPTIHPINHNTIKVDFAFNDNKSNFANTNNTVTTVINNQGTKTIQDTARQPTQPTQHHNNKPGCCTIF